MNEATALIQSFAKKTGQSEKTIEMAWDDIKKGLLKSKKETDPAFYPILVSTVKKKFDLEENISEKLLISLLG